MKDTRHTACSPGRTFCVLVLLACSLAAGDPCLSQGTSHLAEGILLYHEGKYNESLNELREELEVRPRSPLAYYYAALIRLEKQQYNRARRNLEEALSDSSGFHDVHGLLANVLLELGENQEALAEWKRFVQAVGSLEGIPLIVESIIPPDEYHNQLAAETERKRREKALAEERERERLEAERREREELAQELAAIDSARQAERTPADTTRGDQEQTALSPPMRDLSAPVDTARAASAVEPPMSDLEQQITSSIRRGIYGILTGTVILLAGAILVFYLLKRRQAGQEERTFSEEVERLLNDREYELDEDRAIQEFNAKKQVLLQELQPRVAPAAAPREELVEPPRREEPNPPPASEPPPPQTFPSREGETKPQITEEIKALVSRLFREGRTPEEIAHTADLTKTEVDLILAVREHHMEHIIHEIHQDDDDMDRDQLMHAIYQLQREGLLSREIARKLNISLSEVELASSIISMRKQTS